MSRRCCAHAASFKSFFDFCLEFRAFLRGDSKNELTCSSDEWKILLEWGMEMQKLESSRAKREVPFGKAESLITSTRPDRDSMALAPRLFEKLSLKFKSSRSSTYVSAYSFQ